MTSVNRRQMAVLLASGVAATAIPSFAASAVIRSNDTDAVESLEWVQIHPGIWRATFGSPERNSPVALRQVPPALKQLEALPNHTPLLLHNIRIQITPRGCLLRFPLEPDEMVYGLGLQFHSFEQRGKKKTLRVNADPTGDTGDSHAPVPFYVSSLGYGVFVDSFRQTTFYCGDANPAPLASDFDIDTASATHQSTNFGKPSEVVVEVPRAGGVDIYVFAGPTALNVVQRYNLFSGGGPAVPEWGLGFWYRMELDATQETVMALANEFRERKIPCDVIGLEPGWQSHTYSCTFSWNSERFHDPHGFLKDAARLNYKVNLWEHAFTHPKSTLFEPLSKHSGNYGVWGGLVPDFAGEPARRIFGEYHGRELIDAGVSGFKLDECDNSDYTGGWSFPDMSRFPSGLDGEQMHSVYGLRYQDAVWKAFRNRRQTTYNLVRSSGALATPYPFVLYSDLYDHRQFVRALVNSSFSGLLWCPEVRDARSEEDLLRRMQTAAFSPLMMINAWYIKNPPWKQVKRDENNDCKFALDWQMLENKCREIIGWRMQLIPYLLSAFQRYATDGTPPFRALVLDYPFEQNVSAVDDAYLMGDRILVAPLFAGEAAREVKFPSGIWHDYWTGRVVKDGASISVSSATEKIPVFVKSGSVLPLSQVGLSSASMESKNLTVRIYGDGSLPWRIDSVDGPMLELSWNPVTQEGQIQQNAAATSKYHVVRWERMG